MNKKQQKCALSLTVLPYSAKFSKLSRIGLLQIFVEINFEDQGFPLAMPSLAAAYTICSHSHNNTILSKFKYFCSGPNFVWGLFGCSSSSTTCASQARDTSPLSNAVPSKKLTMAAPRNQEELHFRGQFTL